MHALFDNEELFDKALDSVSSETKILKYCKSSLGYIAPREIELKIAEPCLENIQGGVQSDSVGASVSISKDKNGKKTSFQYVPLLQVITRMIEQKDVWESIQRKINESSVHSPDMLSSYCDGTICKKHEVFSDDKYAIRIHLYCDEFEVCNPIGAHRTTHKMSAFYYFIGNLEDRSLTIKVHSSCYTNEG